MGWSIHTYGVELLHDSQKMNSILEYGKNIYVFIKREKETKEQGNIGNGKGQHLFPNIISGLEFYSKIQIQILRRMDFVIIDYTISKYSITTNISRSM